jgi:prepilin-type N-terminal cleavage/methylation domain-containing protein
MGQRPHPPSFKTPSGSGFTLSELLIAIAILGVIATFTLVKVLQVTDTAQNKAKFKEAIATLNTPLFEGVQSGAITDANSGSYMMSKLAGIKVCDTNSLVQGCAPSSQTGYSYELDEPGIVLHSSAMLYGFNDNISSSNAAVIDVNGAAAPNTVGQDQLIIVYCYDPQGCNNDPCLESSLFRSGTISYMFCDFSSNTYRDANKALFLSLFQ